jgi:hypothetical protein
MVAGLNTVVMGRLLCGLKPERRTDHQKTFVLRGFFFEDLPAFPLFGGADRTIFSSSTHVLGAETLRFHTRIGHHMAAPVMGKAAHPFTGNVCPKASHGCVLVFILQWKHGYRGHVQKNFASQRKFLKTPWLQGVSIW